MRNRNKADVVIIGGGIIGMAIARALARRKMRVTVLEMHEPGRGATHAAAGILTLQYEGAESGPFFELCRKSHAGFPSFCQELQEETGIDPQYRSEGTLWPAFDEEEAKLLLAVESAQHYMGLPVQALSPEETRRREPALSPECRGALFLPDDRQVENRLLFHALLASAVNGSVHIEQGSLATGLCVRGDRVTGVESTAGVFPCQWVIVAAGAWSGLFSFPSGMGPLPVRPVKGEMVCLSVPPEVSICHVLYTSRCYMVPRQDGRLLVGATEVEGGFGVQVTAGAAADLLAAAGVALPVARSFPLRDAWAGLRPTAPDRLPLLGSWGIDGLIVATAHYRKGILLAPITGEIVAELIVGGKPSLPLDHFSPNRFPVSRNQDVT